jgi:uncharacterized protein DUF5677
MAARGTKKEKQNLNDDDLVKAVGKALTEQVEQSSLALAKRLRSQSRELREHQAYDRGFKERLAKTWSDAFKLYQVVLLSAVDAGSDFYTDNREQASQENDFRFEALTSLHARACLVAGEVFELLKGGWPHGAHARCRTLHELAVFAIVIGDHPEVAERFLLHDAVENAASMDIYQAKLAGRHGYESLSQAEIDWNHARRDEALKRFGDSFKGRYGWAAELFPKHQPSFGSLEEMAGIDHLRPFSDWATHIGVHASSRGARLNILRRGDQQMRLVGPTNAGLADPASGALISLIQVTTQLLIRGRPLGDDSIRVGENSIRLGDDSMRLVVAKALMQLTDEAEDAFLAAHKRLEEKEARFQETEARRAMKEAKAKPTGRSRPR